MLFLAGVRWLQSLLLYFLWGPHCFCLWLLYLLGVNNIFLLLIRGKGTLTFEQL